LRYWPRMQSLILKANPSSAGSSSCNDAMAGMRTATISSRKRVESHETSEWIVCCSKRSRCLHEHREQQLAILQEKLP
jgi:hypothetical protein